MTLLGALGAEEGQVGKTQTITSSHHLAAEHREALAGYRTLSEREMSEEMKCGRLKCSHVEQLSHGTLTKMIQALLRGDTFKYCLIHLNKSITKRRYSF